MDDPDSDVSFSSRQKEKRPSLTILPMSDIALDEEDTIRSTRGKSHEKFNAVYLLFICITLSYDITR